MPLNIKPCHLRAARDYVSRYHRHSIPPVGGKFAVACYDGDRLCGVAICGRPVARYLDDGLTLEILRCCTDGTDNACSKLYGACCHIGFDMGYVGPNALAAVNLVMPLIMMSFALVDLVAVGSSVQISIRLGEKNERAANRIFSFCTGLIVALSCVIGLGGFFLAGQMVSLMGAEAEVTAMGAEYMQVYAVFAPVIMVFFAVDNYLRICGRVRYSMILNVVTALLNIVLDFLFLVVFRWGVAAAAAASCLSIALGTVLGFLPFVMGRLPLRFVRGTISARQLGNILANGSPPSRWTCRGRF